MFTFPLCAKDLLQVILMLSSNSKRRIYTLSLIYGSLIPPEHGHRIPQSSYFRTVTPHFKLVFTLPLAGPQCLLELNNSISVTCFLFLFFEVSLFLASFPSCLGNRPQIEITGSERSSLFITKDLGELLTQIDSSHPQGGSIALRAQLPLPLNPQANHPHYKISKLS